MRTRQEITVRPACVADLDEVAEVWHDSASLMDGLPRDVPSVEALRRRIEVELGSGWDLRVATLCEHLAGFVATRPTDHVLDQIFVSPPDQGKGVGSKLIGAAKEAMPTGFTLRMDAQNELARRFYVKHGMSFVDEGLHPSTGIPVHFYGWNVS